MVYTSSTLICSNTPIFNFYLRSLFSRTDAYNIDQVLESLCCIETCFRSIHSFGITFDNNFDAKYFCLGLTIILNSYHHHLINRVIEILYYYAHLFTGETRKYIFSDFLIPDYFLKLFLHWNITTRYIFHQLLIFRMVRIPKLRLLEIGIDVEDFDAIKLGIRYGSKLFSPPDIEELIDIEIHGKIKAYIQVVKDPDTTNINDKCLLVYGKRSIDEYQHFYNTYLQSEYELRNPEPLVFPLIKLENQSNYNSMNLSQLKF